MKTKFFPNKLALFTLIAACFVVNVSMGVRQPSQLLSMSNNQVSKLKSLRGWGPKIVQNLIEQVKSYKVNHPTERPRSDDEPLPGEEHLS